MTERSNWLFRDLKELDEQLDLLSKDPEGLRQTLEERRLKVKEDLHNENNKIAGIAKRMLEMIRLYEPLRREFAKLVIESIENEHARTFAAGQQS